MRYRYAPDEEYTDLASGLVLRSAPGHPAFPVRLALELFGRARNRLGAAPLTVWDPVCGSAQLLATLALLRRGQLRAVVGSDVDQEPLRIAERNLALLTVDGLAARQRELHELAESFGKPSHARAARSAGQLAERLAAGGGDLPYTLHQANALDPAELARIAAAHRPELVFADVPYGRQTGWLPHGGRDGEADLVELLGAVLPADSVIVLVARGRRVPLRPGTRALERFRVGHRACVLLRADAA